MLKLTPWDILEIPQNADLKTLKRAYATKLKHHHPEEDPAGFQRIRDAFEWMRAALEDSQTWPFEHSDTGPQTPADAAPQPPPDPSRPNDALGFSVAKELQALYAERGSKAALLFLKEITSSEPFWQDPETLFTFYRELIPFLEATPDLPALFIQFLYQHLFCATRLDDQIAQFGQDRIQLLAMKLSMAWDADLFQYFGQPWHTLHQELSRYQNLAPVIQFNLNLNKVLKNHPDLEPLVPVFLFKAFGEGTLPNEAILHLAETYKLNHGFESDAFSILTREDKLASQAVLAQAIADPHSFAGVQEEPKAWHANASHQFAVFFLIACLSFGARCPATSSFNAPVLHKPMVSYEQGSGAAVPREPSAIVAEECVKAIRMRRNSMVTVFMNSGLNPNTFHDNLSLLEHAMQIDNLEAGRMLLTKGADPNWPNRTGYTPLHRAVLMKSEAWATLLMNHGANPQAKAPNMQTSPLEMARENGLAKLAAVMATQPHE